MKIHEKIFTWLLILSLISFGNYCDLIAEENSDPSKIGEIFSQLPSNSEVHLTLYSSEQIHGTFLKIVDEQVQIQHPLMGKVKIPLVDIKLVVFAEISEDEKQKLAEAKAKKEEAKKIWDASVELGLNGSQGNSQNFNFRTAASTKRETERNKTTFNIIYVLALSENSTTGQNERTDNKLFMDTRSEWPFPKYPRWDYYVSGSLEFNEFTAYDIRLVANTGFGYNWLQKEKIKLSTSLGGGVSREFKGGNDELVPEVPGTIQFEWMITSLLTLTAKAEVFPNLRQLGNFRTGEILTLSNFFSEKKKVGLNFGIDHQYTSIPDGAKNNDIDYFLTLFWRFQ